MHEPTFHLRSGPTRIRLSPNSRRIERGRIGWIKVALSLSLSLVILTKKINDNRSLAIASELRRRESVQRILGKRPARASEFTIYSTTRHLRRNFARSWKVDSSAMGTSITTRKERSNATKYATLTHLRIYIPTLIIFRYSQNGLNHLSSTA